MNDIANGNINNYNIKKEYDKIFIDIEKDLDKSRSSKNVDKLKYFLIKIKNLVNKNDKKSYKVLIKLVNMIQLENMILTCLL